MLDDMVKRAMDEHVDATEGAIKSKIGLRFRNTVDVDIRKPRWMPKRIYVWLMRTIVVTTGPLVVGHATAPKLETRRRARDRA